MARLSKKEVISRLQKTVKKLKALPNRSFNYGNFVTKSKELKDGSTCGTVCCAAGWYPLWFPEAGLIWKDHTLENKNDFHNSNAIENALTKYHGINTDLVNVLFYGQKEMFLGKNKLMDYYLGFSKDPYEVKKDEVVKLFEFVIQLIKKDEIDYKP